MPSVLAPASQFVRQLRATKMRQNLVGMVSKNTINSILINGKIKLVRKALRGFRYKISAKCIGVHLQAMSLSNPHYITTGLNHTGFRRADRISVVRSEEHTSELQSRPHLVCRLLLEKK